MATSVQYRLQNRDLGMVMREVDEDLAIFLGMRNTENERNSHLLLHESLQFDHSKDAEPKADSLLTMNASEVVDDNLINLETESSDFSWLLEQPDSHGLPSIEINLQDSDTSQTKISDGEGISSKSETENTSGESSSISENSLQPTNAIENTRPSSSRGRKPTPRAATPTRRPALPAKTKPSRPSTPTSRATLSSSKPVAAQSRSSTPTRPRPRSSTPTPKPSIPVILKSAPRPTTPTRKSTTSVLPALDRSSSGRKMGSTMSRSSVPSRGTSPTVKSRPSKPSEMLSLSHNAPENLKVIMPKRPASASRGRPSKPATRPSSSDEKERQKSCSPPKVRAPITTTAYKTGSRMLSRSRGYGNEGDDVNPVLMGTQMVDRVVNMRKLAPPKQDEYVSHDNPRKSSLENSGFGRSLSKKSLDMAIRHMDIRKTVPEKLRAVATRVLPSSYSLDYGDRSGCGKSSTTTSDLSESPVSSTCDSSKSSM